MTNFLTSRRSLSILDKLRANRLGRGMSLFFQAAPDNDSNTPSELLIRTTLLSAPLDERVHIQSDIGCLSIEQKQAELFLNALSSMPFVQTSSVTQTEEQEWYVTLYNQGLYPTIFALFGNLSLGGIPDDSAQAYELTWSLPEQAGKALIYLSDNTLEQLLERQPWQPHSSLDVSSLLLTYPISLGRTHLPYSDVLQLGIGDVLVPNEPMFSPQGQGSMRFFDQNVQLEFIGEGTLCAYQVTYLSKATVEELNMYDEYDNSDAYDTSHDTPSTPQSDGLVQLSLQAGEVSLTIQELSQLHVGSVLTASGEIPGHATLYQGKTAIARGELVEVDGRLGIQLTQVLLNQAKHSEGITS